MSKILRIDMWNKTISYEDALEKYELFGGRGLIASILNDEVDPECDPLGKENKLIVCPGLMTGSAAPCSGRLSVGGKSPLTGTIKEANAGGIVAMQMAKLDLKAIVVESRPEKAGWSILLVRENEARLISADEYAGMNNYELTEKLFEVYGDHIGIASIGGAGERGYCNSTVQITGFNGYPSRAAARGGLGAVMGSKGLKAIVVDARKPSNPKYADKERFLRASRGYIAGIRENGVSGQAMPALGTAVLVNMVNAIGALPTRNYSRGSFEHAEEISGESLLKLQGQRNGKVGHPCHPGCVIGCSNTYNDEKGNYLTSGLEYETIGMVGSNCGISSLDTIAEIDRLCDDFGLDTMDTGATIGICMEAGLLPFGDERGAIGLVKEMIEGTELGRLLGHGADYAGRILGVKRIPTVKGQALAAYDPRSLKGTGVTYATSPMGADHTAGNSLGNPAADPVSKEGQVELSGGLQVGMATFDNLGMCIFSGFCTDKPANVAYLVEMMAARFGGEWDANRLFGIGAQTLILEKSFNSKAGFTAADDRLPEFMYMEALEPNNTVFDINGEELSRALAF
ncbi:MAG TPA: aldehyde ferredoxin oxidoreductase C-terminal domain-containing protein [Negativicutes bacterium]|nr:aldehyde ferredoxin oxidoreductase C-terminal domain-containing protein [Negativicutes bacterium]